VCPCVLQETNTIKVWNNGDGIPVEMHKEEGVYVPELIFGHLLTSSNYNDMEKKVRAVLRASTCLQC
jgi:DNA topoisomerase-2